MDRYRNNCQSRAYRVEHQPGAECPWRVYFIADGEETGGGRYQTAEQADEAGVDYMFGLCDG